MENSDTQQPAPPSHESPSDDEAKAKEDAGEASPAVQKPSLPKRLWTASGLNSMTLIMMFKGAIAPTIALAIYEATSIARIYSTLGYLVAIMSILSMPIMPRSKFVSHAQEEFFPHLIMC